LTRMMQSANDFMRSAGTISPKSPKR
jgi:hypothetical protein